MILRCNVNLSNGGLVISSTFCTKKYFFANSFFDKNRNANILFYQKSSQVSDRSTDSIEISINK